MLPFHSAKETSIADLHIEFGRCLLVMGPAATLYIYISWYTLSTCTCVRVANLRTQVRASGEKQRVREERMQKDG